VELRRERTGEHRARVPHRRRSRLGAHRAGFASYLVWNAIVVVMAALAFRVLRARAATFDAERPVGQPDGA
jgi:hypothetical protein